MNIFISLLCIWLIPALIIFLVILFGNYSVNSQIILKKKLFIYMVYKKLELVYYFQFYGLIYSLKIY